MGPRSARPDPPTPAGEMNLVRELAGEMGTTLPPVARRDRRLDDGRTVSALHWRTGRADVVLLHGGGQNAHTWDGVCLHLGRPAVAVDLPGHGHSSWRAAGDYAPWHLAADLDEVLDDMAPRAQTLVGMSLGGLTAIALAERRPSIASLLLVDVTPGVRPGRTRNVELMSAAPSYARFDDMLEVTASLTGRPATSIRRGLLHNARQREDGRWVWRHHFGNGGGGAIDYSPLWGALAGVRAHVTLVLGAHSQVVSPADLARFQRERPDAQVVTVEGAGHSVQGTHPETLAALTLELTGDRRKSG